MSTRVSSPLRKASVGRPMGDTPQSPPLRFGDDPYVWACWLYYQDRLTQSQIAEAMGVSRATVNAYLSEARDRGIVNISLEPARLASLTVADEIRRHFGLESCLVVPSEETHPLIDRLGRAGALALQSLLKSGDTLGVVWGRTIMAVAEHLKSPPLQDMTVVQATGSTQATFAYTPDLCTTAFAEALSAKSIKISAPAIVGSPELARAMMGEPLIADELAALAKVNRIIFGISSLRPNSTIHASGFFEQVSLQHYLARGAAGVLAGRFIDQNGAPVDGPLHARTIGIPLDVLTGIKTRIAVAGGFDKVPALLAMLRGGYANILITDAATGRGILNAEGVAPARPQAKTPARTPVIVRTQIKKFLNRPDDAVDEMLEGAINANRRYLKPVAGSNRALVARHGPRPGKVGLVIGGGSGHEPCFLGYVGRGLADAVAIGNIFSSPPPDPIAACAQAASGDAGVLFAYGNYSGDVMNFEMAAEQVEERGIKVRTVLTTDDIASSPIEDRDGRRGVAGNVLIFKVAGAACDLGLPLEACEAVTRKANARTYTIGVGLEPCSLPQIRRPTFELGPDDMEVGIGIHGEPGVARESLKAADAIVDTAIDAIFKEMDARPNERVAVLVNSFGATPMMELYILYRRVEQRLSARGIVVEANWIGPYCTSLDMVGASITIMHLDNELSRLLSRPCDTAAFKVL
ncbi:bifunctional sugar-binding transcriptional regulator/dihydroxyacetone kinase subunit DhaK [Rhodobium orientis]|uniref:3,4-dihydroxy-2-butanone kinase n=1 Tax=Rhodobium orientis TaxID=34017 RepID=A0A327JMH9_9HYPH|nr:3,4-dihydroxy-2-butanone kinase [Rhodobium orientis]RAI27619.1 3,4-dihydroxy-2-butanone kinase [Rhodobium orientis]